MTDPPARALQDYVLLNTWRFDRVIGAGADGTVYLARHLESGEPVAVKVYDSMVDEALDVVMHRIESEVALVRAAASPWLIGLHHHGVRRARGGRRAAYIVMDYLQGQSLRSLMNLRGALPAADADALMAGLLQGVAAIHRAGWVHLDLKPDNAWVRALHTLHEPGAVVLFDFGNARPLATAFTVGARGTPLYAAPEICNRDAGVGPPADVYALGILLYELVAGRPPMPVESVEQIVATHVWGTLDPWPAHAPGWMRPLWERAVERDPARRFPDADAMLRAWTGQP
jgi:serine/threonine-protein kinase